uniref:FAD dependent oxidoreductase (LhgO) n=1 Tax=uncultured marine thaumarchaeote KM3_23_E01 TaxID=1456099 RepID=A0A075GZH1_9ARCH|nr:FAD dependent oxidoreductase (lhgO) [uncultured marine thaumarchaeote KM3_23_E01]
MQKYDIAIIGGGILGTAISYWLSILYDLKICVIEKEHDVALHSSTRNSGVIHYPFYINPKQKKNFAKAAFLSHEMWKSLANEKKIPWVQGGTIEIALDEEQHKTLEKYMIFGKENGLTEEDISILDSNQLKQKEPNLTCYSGLYCTKEGSTNYGMLTKAVTELAKKNGINFLLKHNVKYVEETSKDVNIIFSDNSSLTTNFVINCAGGNSLDIAKKFRLLKGYSDLHFRGEYWVANSNIADLVKTNIYTVPRYLEFPFLDPHWIKRANGETEIGPNAVPVDSPEAYDSFITDVPTALSKILDIVTGSTKKLLLNRDFISLVSKEFLSTISKSAMIERVKKFIPAIKPENFPKRGTSGIRTPVISPQGEFVSEMIEIEGKNSFHIVNYNTPGATGAPAYSAFVVKKLQEKGILAHSKNQKNSIWNFNKIFEQD